MQTDIAAHRASILCVAGTFGRFLRGARAGQFLGRSVGDLHHARQQEFTGLERHSRRDIDRLDLAVSRTSRATVGGV
jgi:hypothetical protein